MKDNSYKFDKMSTSGVSIQTSYWGRLINDLTIFKSTGKGTLSADDVQQCLNELKLAKTLLRRHLSGEDVNTEIEKYLSEHDEISGYTNNK